MAHESPCQARTEGASTHPNEHSRSRWDEAEELLPAEDPLLAHHPRRIIQHLLRRNVDVASLPEAHSVPWRDLKVELLREAVDEVIAPRLVLFAQS